MLFRSWNPIEGRVEIAGEVMRNKDGSFSFIDPVTRDYLTFKTEAEAKAALEKPYYLEQKRVNEAAEYESRLFGGAYSEGHLNRAAKDAMIRKLIPAARDRYNAMRREAGLPEVTDWSKPPEQRLGPTYLEQSDLAAQWVHWTPEKTSEGKIKGSPEWLTTDKIGRAHV